MKPRNFPERRNARRKIALSNLTISEGAPLERKRERLRPRSYDTGIMELNDLAIRVVTSRRDERGKKSRAGMR